MKAIIFDFDGVILDSVQVKTRAFADMYKPYGKDIEAKVIEHHLQHGGVSRYEKFKIYHRYFLNEEINETKVQALAHQFSDLVLKKVLESSFIPGAKEFLDKVFVKYQTFVCTGTPQNEIERIVFERGLSMYFDELHGSPDKKITIIKRILGSHQLDKNEVLFIGDAMTDYKAAHHCGLHFIGVVNGYTRFPEGTVLVNNLMEILEKLK